MAEFIRELGNCEGLFFARSEAGRKRQWTDGRYLRRDYSAFRPLCVIVIASGMPIVVGEGSRVAAALTTTVDGFYVPRRAWSNHVEGSRPKASLEAIGLE